MDPAQRITVEEILANPWVRETAGIPQMDPMEAALVADLARTSSTMSQGEAV